MTDFVVIYDLCDGEYMTSVMGIKDPSGKVGDAKLCLEKFASLVIL
jgi:hypothetical protein